MLSGMNFRQTHIRLTFANSWWRSVVLAALVVVTMSMLMQRASALPTFPDVVSKTYALKPGGMVAKAAEACTLCHVDAGPPKLNSYGNDVKAALETAHTKTLTPEILHSIDAKDSDGDGATNAMEFAADTLPGAPTSKPAGTVAPVASPAAAKPAAEDSSPLAVILKLAFPKHAQHPVLVHFPIGLFIISLLFDVLAVWKKDRSLALAGYYNLAVAAVTALFSVASGLLAWWFAFAHEAFNSDRNLLFHLILGITTLVLISLLWLMRFRTKDKGARPSNAYVILGLIALIVISITGHLGGNLTGVN